MAYTEVKRTNYGGRLKDSCSGVIMGIIMFIAGTVLIWWNEDRTKKTADMLEEAQEVCVDVDNVSKVNPELNGSLIHASANAITTDTISDSQFAEVRANAISIRRKSQYYQWVEESHTETKEKIGGTKEEITTYTYKKEWTNSPVNSSNFHDPQYQGANSVRITIEDDNVYASNVSFGAYTFTEQMIRQIGGAQPMEINISDETLAELSRQVDPSRNSLRNTNSYYNTASSTTYGAYGDTDAVNDINTDVFGGNHPYANVSEQGTIYFGKSQSTPEVGDVKVSYTYVPSDVPVSILAKVNGSSFSSWQAKNKKTLLVVSAGTLSSEEMFQSEHDANNMIKWLCRIGGLLLIILGLKAMFAIVSAIFNFLPFLAHIVNAGVGLVCGVLGTVWALIVFAIAWIAARPVLGISVLVVAVGLIVFLIVRSRQKKAQADNTALQNPTPVATTPSGQTVAASNQEGILGSIRQKIEQAAGSALTEQQPAQPQYPQPAQQQYPQPAQQQYPQPAQHQYPQPTQPQYPQPAQQQYPQPAQPQYPQPAQPQYPQPAQPAKPEQTAGASFCTQCGSPIPAGSVFCPKCGTRQQ